MKLYEIDKAILDIYDNAEIKDLRELRTLNKIQSALDFLGQYVDNASEDDGHNDEVVDKAYKLLQEVVAKWD